MKTVNYLLATEQQEDEKEDEKHSSTNASGAHAWHVTHSVAPP